MPRTPRGKDKPHAAKAFVLRRHAGRWQVRDGTHWMTAIEVSLLAPAICLPNGDIVGTGVVDRDRAGKTTRITA